MVDEWGESQCSLQLRVPIHAGSIARLAAALRSAPTTIPAAAAFALFVIWACDQGGYPVTHWAPGGLIVLALLAIALWSVPCDCGRCRAPS